MRVLVTGGAGFIGSHVVERLCEAGHKVGVLDDLRGGGAPPPGAEFFEQSLAESEAVVAAFHPERVIHLAAQIDVRRSVEDPPADADVNIMGSLKLFDAARQYGVGKVIFASSAAVYGDPVQLPIDEEHPYAPSSPYGLAKLTVEGYLRLYESLYGLRYTVLRYANVYGPGQRAEGDGAVVAVFASRLAAGQPITVNGDGEQTRDFVYVTDVAEANRLALAEGDGQVFNVSGASKVSVNALFHLIGELSGEDVVVHHGPPRPGDIRHSLLANDRAQRVLGWQPRVALRDGLKRTLVYWRA